MKKHGREKNKTTTLQKRASAKNKNRSVQHNPHLTLPTFRKSSAKPPRLLFSPPRKNIRVNYPLSLYDSTLV